MIRDSVNAVEARSILAAQASRTERLSAADDVIVNSGSVPELRQAVDQLHQRYLEMASR
jgi:dephospho-CoA kinase